jgi:hypothetical protein
MIKIKIIVLFLFLLFVENYPKVKKFSVNTKFNIYRSLMCLFFTLYSIENTVNNLFNGIIEPYDFKYKGFTDISEWFLSYLVLDIGKMIWIKNTRLDLYLHHIAVLITFSAGFYYNKIGFIYSFGLINEILSVLSGIDSIYIEEKLTEESKKCKFYRKNIIKYIRRPIWLIMLLITLYNKNNLPIFIFCNHLIGSIFIIILDIYWERKCNKIIELKHDKL